ncbi:MAG TPA: mannose-6-phosphate isomerase, class I [Microbacteriaceae bacterium]|nr:mannose-6-phosphate isomerase, class I [Microbacteriaceae bacterium]
MFLSLHNSPRAYSWGADGAISRLLGREAQGGPEAEYWLGAHPASPALVSSETGQRALNDWIAENQARALGGRDRLPYLLKVLAAGAPLSLQVHPSRAQAIEGCAREDALGIPRDASHRNYRDDNHKPELILALEDGFVALCGIRPESERQAIARELDLVDVLGDASVSQVFARLLAGRGTPAVHELVNRAVAAANRRVASPFAEAYRWMGELAERYPGDPGALLSLLLNLVTLRAGEALYLPAGNLHAYLSGIGVELMADSDNVLRGGLTEKHIDIDELLAVTVWDALPVPRIEPVERTGGKVFAGDVPDFELVWVESAARVELNGPAIVLNLGSAAEVRGATGAVELARGSAVFVTPDEGALDVVGERVFVALPGRRTGSSSDELHVE